MSTQPEDEGAANPASPFFAISEDIRRSFERAAQIFPKIDGIGAWKPFFEITEEQRLAMEQFGSRFREMFGDVRASFEQINKAFRLEAFGTDCVFPSMEQFGARYRESLYTLARNGWYADTDFGLATLHSAARAFDEGRNEWADRGMTNLIDKEAANIVARINASHPEHADAILKGLKAHQAGDYEASVLIFLSQADGIGFRHFRESIYSRSQRNLKKLKEGLTPQSTDTGTRIYWELLLEDLPIWRRCPNGEVPPGQLNRHAVMHGYSTDYGTRMNSTRALSLLNFMAEIKGFFGLYQDPEENSDV